MLWGPNQIFWEDVNIRLFIVKKLKPQYFVNAREMNTDDISKSFED